MNKTRVLIFGSIVGAALLFGAAVGATASRIGFSPAGTVLAALIAASPSPSPKSNEAATHESGESAAQETAENNGTARPGGPGGPGGHPCGGPGHSNEVSTHETGETAAQEASENAACPVPAAGTTSPATN